MRGGPVKEVWAQANYYFSQIWDGWALKVPLATLAGLYTDHTGGKWALLVIFSGMIAVDLFFGTWLAAKRRCFNVRLFGRWVVKAGTHFFVIYIVGVAVRSILEPLGISFPLLDLFLGMLICTETLSVLKNMRRLGLPVPRLATRILTDVQDKAERKAADFFSRPENDRRRSPRPETGGHSGGAYDDDQD
jgi:toxin secretion/phage lysis holin